GTELDREAGFYHVGQERLVWQALRKLGAPVPRLRVTARAFLDAWARVTPVAPAASAAPPLPPPDAIERPVWPFTLGAGLGTSPLSRMPAIIVGFDSRVTKDTALPADLEPLIYFAHLFADAALAPDEEDVPYARAGLGVFGVRAAWLDDHAQAEALRALFRRNVALDQRYGVTASALGGRIRTMPGFLKYPGELNLFAELGVDLLGYDFLRHVTARP